MVEENENEVHEEPSKSIDDMGTQADLSRKQRPTKINQDPGFMYSSQHQIDTAPAIDFKLNVKIEINSGKCVLHANKANGAKTDQSRSDQTPNSTFYNYYGSNMNEFQKQANFMQFMANTANNLAAEHEMRNTNFIFPAIGVKAFYESKHKRMDNKLTKKANLYAMIKLESFAMPQPYTNLFAVRDASRDMCISPALLDFLEQTLEPFDIIKASLESATAIKINKSQQFQFVNTHQAWVICYLFLKKIWGVLF